MEPSRAPGSPGKIGFKISILVIFYHLRNMILRAVVLPPNVSPSLSNLFAKSTRYFVARRWREGSSFEGGRK